MWNDFYYMLNRQFFLTLHSDIIFATTFWYKYTLRKVTFIRRVIIIAFIEHWISCTIYSHPSSTLKYLSTPKFKLLHTPTFDHRVHKSTKHFSNSFSHYAPVLWNSFPFQIRNSPSVASFRKRLKTHLFNFSSQT